MSDPGVNVYLNLLFIPICSLMSSYWIFEENEMKGETSNSPRKRIKLVLKLPSFKFTLE